MVHQDTINTTNTTIDNYNYKKLLVADFVIHTDNKTKFIIQNGQDFVGELPLYQGTRKNLSSTKYGAVHEICNMIVSDFDVSADTIILHVKENNNHDTSRLNCSMARFK